eukprot:6177818-Pleurochrysis_carterae.AAC.6
MATIARGCVAHAGPSPMKPLGIFFAVGLGIALALGALYWVQTHPPAPLRPLSHAYSRFLIRVSRLAILPKVKLLIAFYQAVNVIPDVYAVGVPTKCGARSSPVFAGTTVPAARRCRMGPHASTCLATAKNEMLA